MACVAINGYHSRSTYSWEHDGAMLQSENTPLLYASGKGSYICAVKCQTFQSHTEFTVYGEYYLLDVHAVHSSIIM